MFKNLKSEIRISKSEIPTSSRILDSGIARIGTSPNDKNQKLKTSIWGFEHLNFKFVSDFALRALNLFRAPALVSGTLKHTTYNISRFCFCSAETQNRGSSIRRPRFTRVESGQHTTYKANGFSLIEVLVAVSVLIISVTGTLSIIAREVSSAAIAKDQVVAFYLAQEALEYVRGVRDNNAINNQSWLNGLDQCLSPSKCVIDVTADPIASESEVQSCVGTCPLLFDAVRGVYNQNNHGDPTIFTREVQIVGVDNTSSPTREVRVNATVRWTAGVERSFTISGNLFNWR